MEQIKLIYTLTYITCDYDKSHRKLQFVNVVSTTKKKNIYIKFKEPLTLSLFSPLFLKNSSKVPKFNINSVGPKTQRTWNS